MSKMTPDLRDYFSGFVPERDEILRELEEEAERENIPIVGPVVGELLFILARAAGAASILELGTATGYSTIFLARALPTGRGRVLTLERAPGMAQRAEDNFEKAGVAGGVEVLTGDAIELMKTLDGPFDMVFFDIDKEHYLPALGQAIRLLRVGGLLVADNVGFTGARDFNREVFAKKELRLVHLLCFLPLHSPEEDGLTLAVRVE